MKSRVSVYAVCFAVSVCLLLAAGASFAQKKAAEPMSLKVEGAKMAPVNFSHATHAEKNKIDCAVCHHKDADAKNPAACTSCHAVKEAKGGASVAKDAFHGKCQGCHKDAAGKGKAAPTKCTECHKK